MTAAEQNWQQQCQEIHHACSNRNWSQVIQQCRDLIQYAQQQSGATTAAQQSYQGHERQQQMHIQAHAEQD
ncbi:hypothetical protein [Cohnella caldifontis]|uniref:hypothetical protein n=1 Tax=Cohnella caldifontis TaxID=3027471 RepID=UPI0023EE1119|nr:hypothetical protein [Cohnella sp. YIM B05605]